MSFILSPSLLSADFANLQSEVERLNISQADWLHLDVMDGAFVPNISFGMPVIEAIKKHASKPLDVHLMIEKPERYIHEFKQAGADLISVHYQACTHLNRCLDQIRKEGLLAGVVLNPHIPVSVLESILPYADFVLLMSVNPGFGGQKFIENTIDKIKELHKMKLRLNPELIIEIDGGVSLENAPVLLRAGANALVAGNALFSAPDLIKRIEEFKNCEN